MNKKPINILLIEDNPNDIRLIQEMLVEKNSLFHLECTNRLKEGLELIASNDFDLVLLDLGLPDSQGLETFFTVHAKAPEVPVIALTGLEDEELATEGIRKGLQDYLIKDQVESNLLVRAINHAIERQQMHLELERIAKDLKTNEAALRNIIEQNADGIIIVDENGVIRFVNPASAILFGRGVDELLGQHFGFPVVSGEKTEIDINRKDGEALTAEMDVIETIWEREKAYQASLRDITEHKRLVQAKDEFISTVSHELRTPLSIIKEGISLVLDQVPGEINEHQNKILAIAKKNIDRLARIINDLLDMSKIEADKVELRKTWVDAASVIKMVATTFESKVKEKGLELRISSPEKRADIYVDEDKITQVLTILVDNAIKFTSQGFIEISVDEKDNLVECAVVDTGIGIAKEDLPNLFDKFTQFGRKDGPGEKGTGLGLSIAKGIVGLHNGNIRVESEVGEGTKFTISLPKLSLEEIFKQHLSKAIKEAEEKGSPFSVISISILNFKESIHESHEKAKGAARKIEEVIKNSLRNGDIVVSDIGEILLILPETKREGALLVLERTKEKIRQYLSAQKVFKEKINLNKGIISFPDEAKEEKDILDKIKEIKNG